MDARQIVASTGRIPSSSQFAKSVNPSVSSHSQVTNFHVSIDVLLAVTSTTFAVWVPGTKYPFTCDIDPCGQASSAKTKLPSRVATTGPKTLATAALAVACTALHANSKWYLL
ncbi:unnamed protein product [Phytophthora fragariaefolia]|uniref:Unnamed protein product n=1 Tax=Phytophthora fragariaefolia TaxID=1490495 RepID=A0A9W7D7F1_9STRA|nr:unnamed protein product [Phytophthora fragariaefolia]